MLAFFGPFTCGDMVAGCGLDTSDWYLGLENILWDKYSIKIRIRFSKTDRIGTGHEINLPFTSSPPCSCQLLQEHLVSPQGAISTVCAHLASYLRDSSLYQFLECNAKVIATEARTARFTAHSFWIMVASAAAAGASSGIQWSINCWCCCQVQLMVCHHLPGKKEPSRQRRLHHPSIASSKLGPPKCMWLGGLESLKLTLLMQLGFPTSHLVQ